MRVSVAFLQVRVAHTISCPCEPTVIYDDAGRRPEVALYGFKRSGHGGGLEEVELELQVAVWRNGAVDGAA